MRYQNLAKEFFISNRKKLINKMIDNSMLMLFSPDKYHRNGDQYYKFRQNSNLYQLSGINQEETILILTQFGSHIESEEMLLIKEVNNMQRIWHGEKLKIGEAQQLSGIDHVKWNTEFDAILRQQLSWVKNIYYEASPNHKSFDGNPTSNMRRMNALKEEFPEKSFIPINSIMDEIRLIKQEEELVAIRKAVSITRGAYDRILSNTKPDMFEYEVEAEITYEFIRQGASGHAYIPIVASARNACFLHYVDNDKLMKDGDLLLLDFGAEYANYAADCSRTIPINGKFSPRQADCYNAVLEVFKKAKAIYIPGNTIDNINEQVGKWMQEKMVDLGLLSAEEIEKYEGEEPLYKKYFMHGTAHFIGLDVHDVGSKTTIFEKGMLLSCEPGLYIEEEGIGIRIETDMLVADEPVDLMADFPITVEEIEREMSFGVLI